MHEPSFGGRIFKTFVALLLIAGALIAAPGRASASTCVSGIATQPPHLYFASGFRSVTALSSCNVWAVGSYFTDLDSLSRTLIEHWNGAAWQQVPSPNPGAYDNWLTGVAALSATNIWAVGGYFLGSGTQQSMILHWNGTVWQQVPSPNAGGSTGSNALWGVTAVSATNIWAVGYFSNSTGYHTLVLHWNGTTWSRVWSPSPGASASFKDLVSVAGVSATNAWAVGTYFNGSAQQTLIEHWNGTAWKRVWSPNPGGAGNDDDLAGVTAVSASNVWAVGGFSNGTADQTLTLHWNGTAWKRVWSPNPGGAGNDDSLRGVAAVSASNIWAVGAYSNGSMPQTLVEHWNGTAWKRVSSPNPGGTDEENSLTGVAASSSTNIWAVGTYLIGDGELGTEPIALRYG